MPDNLRITAPIPANEGAGKTNPLKEPSNAEAVNPARAAQPNAPEQGEASRSLELLLNLESVYGKFIRQLRSTPPLSKSLGRALGDAVAAQGRQTEPTPLGRLVEALPASEEEILENLRFQQENGSEFSGPFFRLLNLLSENGGDAGFDLQLAGFLKAYDAFRNADSATRSILRDVKTIAGQIPRNYAESLKALAGKLSGERPVEDAPANLGVLKGEILPLLCRYVSRTNDYGKSRETVSLLLHHITMLEAGVKTNVAGSFRKLLDYAKYNLNLPKGTVDAMQALFAEELKKMGQTPRNEFLDSLVSLLKQRGRDGAETGLRSGQQPVWKDVCSSLLLDSSVYMPFTHLFLPCVCGGRYLFAQMWVEKDDGSARPAGAPAADKPLRVFLSFEIQDLGHFEASVALTGKDAELSLGYPPALDGSRGEIREALASIFGKNGLFLSKTDVSPCREPKIEREIMKKVEERKHAVNVTV